MAIVLAAGLAGTAIAQQYEHNKDRPGSDYRSFDVVTGGVAVCGAACLVEANCKAWTWVKTASPDKGRCYLKSAVPTWVDNNCCISGSKLIGKIPPGREYNTDRPGSDMATIPLRSPNVTTCAEKCATSVTCKAWTFVSPGVQGAQARCYLKNAVPAKVKNDCCISGVVARPLEIRPVPR